MTDHSTSKSTRKGDRAKLNENSAEIRKLEAALKKETAPAKPGTGKPKHEIEPMEIHPLAQHVPEMSPERYKEFRADIEAHGGLTDPIITTYEGKILDGRHRSRACVELGIPRQFEPYKGTDPAGFIISKNTRRDLTEDQRIQMITDLRAAQFEAEAQERKQATQFGAKPTVGMNSSPPGRPREKIAAELKASGIKASEHKVRQALAAREAGLSEVVKAGQMPLKEAAKTAPTKPRKAKPRKLPFDDDVWNWFVQVIRSQKRWPNENNLLLRVQRSLVTGTLSRRNRETRTDMLPKLRYVNGDELTIDELFHTKEGN